MGSSLVTLPELVDALEDPTCSERWSVAAGEPWLAVDLRRAFPTALSPTVLQRLGALPAVTMGIGAPEERAQPDALRALTCRLDVVVPDEVNAAEVVAAVAPRPLASLALVQLLRQSEAMPIEQAVVAESLVYSLLQAGPEFASWLSGRSTRPRETSTEPAVLVLRDEDTLRLRLNRPEKRNAYSAEMRDALCEALRLVLRDASIRSVQLSGAGPAFSSGGDLDEFGSFPDPVTAHAIRSTRNAGLLLAACAERVEARVHGACIGAGVELPAFCRRVTAAPDAFFALPEVGMGLVPGAGGTASLPRRIGRQRTAWLALTGRRLDAPTALSWGLVDAVER